MNELSTPGSYVSAKGSRSRSLMGRRLLVIAGMAGSLAVGATVSAGTASAAEGPRQAAAMTSGAHAFPTWCPFGTHGGNGGGCRGGGLVEEINDSGYTTATNVGCGLVGLGAGAATANPGIGFGVGVGCGILLDDEPAS